MKVKHTFIYVCVIIFALVMINRIQSPNLDFTTKILHILSVVGFFLLCSFLIHHLDVLENKA